MTWINTLSLVTLITVLFPAATEPALATLERAVLTGDAPQMTVRQCTDPGAVLDVAVAEQMEASDLPGLTLSLVSDGDLLVTQGYGYANVADGIPIDPYETLFPAGSVTKLIT